MHSIIYGQAMLLDAVTWGYTMTRLVAALDPFQARLGDVTVRIKNAGDFLAAHQTTCEIVVEIPGEGMVSIRESTQTLHGAISAAARRAGSAVAQQLGQTHSRRHAVRRIRVQ